MTQWVKPPAKQAWQPEFNPGDAQKKSDAALGCLKSQYTRGKMDAREDSPEVGLKPAT